MVCCLIVNLFVSPVERPKWLLLAICPKILGGGGDLQMVLCHFINAGRVVGTLRNDGNTQTVPVKIKLIYFCLNS